MKVLDLKENEVKIGIVAPHSVAVHRLEIHEAIQAKNAQAVSVIQVDGITNPIRR